MHLLRPASVFRAIAARLLVAAVLLPCSVGALRTALRSPEAPGRLLLPSPRPDLAAAPQPPEPAEPHPAISPHGLLLAASGIAALTLLGLLIAWVQGDYWDHLAHRSGTSGRLTKEEAMEHWIVLAKTSQLDFYTCVGIRSCIKQSFDWSLASRALLLMVMQGILPLLLVVYHIRDFQAYSVFQDMSFRLVGFILFMFSVIHMYSCAYDECRVALLDLALHYRCLSWWYILPLVVGELLNAFSAYALVVTLYLVFCHVDNTPELLVHCLALNFIMLVDNDVVGEDLRYFAIDKLRYTLDETGRRHSYSGFQYCFIKLIKHSCAVARNVATLCIGSMLAFIFLFSHQETWCRLFGSYSAWPFCAGLP